MKDSLGEVQSILVLGGTSEIGLGIARRLVGARHASVVLAGRDPAGLEAAAIELRTHGAGVVETLAFDALDFGSHDTVVDKAVGLIGDLDIVVMAFGRLGDQATDEAGGPGGLEVVLTNYAGSVSVGLAVARRLRQQGHGTLVVLSSVAGERVRRTNFIYGSSKAGLDGFAQGLGDALAGTGVRVLIVRPGFVIGRMTAGMTPKPLSTTTEGVATAVVRALQRGHEMVWVPAALRWVMMVARHLPRPVFRKLQF